MTWIERGGEEEGRQCGRQPSRDEQDQREIRTRGERGECSLQYRIIST